MNRKIRFYLGKVFACFVVLLAGYVVAILLRENLGQLGYMVTISLFTVLALLVSFQEDKVVEEE